MKNQTTAKAKTLALALAVLTLILAIFPTTTVSAAYPTVSSSTYIKAYPITLRNDTPAYGSKNGKITGTIYASDELYTYSIDDSRIYCSYPTANGRKYAHIPTSVVTTGKSSGHIDGTATAQTTTYRRASTADTYGYIAKYDKVTRVSADGSFVQVIYPVSGGWKMG